jgi:hypothetical protein
MALILGAAQLSAADETGECVPQLRSYEVLSSMLDVAAAGAPYLLSLEANKLTWSPNPIRLCCNTVHSYSQRSACAAAVVRPHHHHETQEPHKLLSHLLVPGPAHPPWRVVSPSRLRRSAKHFDV